ncbi:hypothetical protein [Nocardia rhizosphaerihabitans]|uniref:Integrase catalytic domain-containing protein n=1 Tax=Nocardia rhizosphaerihabitans TaxID=1691570 RepID=A0ABQ2KZE6_9NOCA|nr:hypothetical protein [Nocardia rhizosphaerihabitans]GGN97860.1 hypothetical protein GCM10011610_64270 [Nocardia rhizosphaerihabitans]
MTWFVDTEHCVIMGVAVTPKTPNREAILAALRAAILRTPPYGPAGGVPTIVRSADAYTTEYVAKALDQLKAEGIDVAGTGYQPVQVTPTEGGK